MGTRLESDRLSHYPLRRVGGYILKIEEILQFLFQLIIPTGRLVVVPNDMAKFNFRSSKEIFSTLYTKTNIPSTGPVWHCSSFPDSTRRGDAEAGYNNQIQVALVFIPFS